MVGPATQGISILIGESARRSQPIRHAQKCAIGACSWWKNDKINNPIIPSEARPNRFHVHPEIVREGDEGHWSRSWHVRVSEAGPEVGFRRQHPLPSAEVCNL